MRQGTQDGQHFMLMEAGEIVKAAQGNAKWMQHQTRIQAGNGIMSIAQFERCAVLGDNSYVERSEKFLAQIEDQVPLSQGWRNVDDVVGALPNVPAFLAGYPNCMRRRTRVDKENAPLRIFMNLTSSMGIWPEQVLRRGITLLAFTRLMIMHRPVELWVGSALRDGVKCATVAWRIDTAPLDLARAAFHIADVSMSRLFGYAMCEQLTNCHLGGGREDHEAHKWQLMQFAGWPDVLYIPRFDLRDPLVSDPVGWIKRELAKYTGAEQQEE